MVHQDYRTKIICRAIEKHLWNPFWHYSLKVESALDIEVTDWKRILLGEFLITSEKHQVTIREVYECFKNRKTKYAYDTRPEHQTNPPTLWFLAESNTNRLLKVVFVRYSKTDVVLKSAYQPNADEIKLYEMYKRGVTK
jgi:uncharacterized DUF497 family protein